MCWHLPHLLVFKGAAIVFKQKSEFKKKYKKKSFIYFQIPLFCINTIAAAKHCIVQVTY